MLGSPEVAEFIQYERMGLDKANSLLEKGELTAVVVLPEGFTYNTFINLAMPFRNPINIEVIKHPDHSIKGEVVTGILKGFTDALSAGIIAKNVLLEASIENNVGDKATGEIEGLISGMYDVGIRDIKIDKVTVEGKRTVSSFSITRLGYGGYVICIGAAAASIR